MKKIYLVSYFSFLLMLLCRLTAAQEQKNIGFQFRVSPLSLLDPRAATIQLGVQANIKNRLGFSVDYGLPYKKLAEQIYTNPDLQSEQHEYHRIRAEVKYFMPPAWVKANEKSRPYFSSEIFFGPEKYRKKDDWLLKDEDAYHYEYSDVTRKMQGVCLKVGLEYTVLRRLLLDVFVGPGLRRIKIDHHTFKAELREYDPPVDFYIEPVDKREGTFSRIHLGLGFKVGFILI
ncbi:hypothetical protein AHMF7605_16750 [Adhaeribacter arboris]|uniref:DUF3575 domain-containing protein n=1 Tax=Adhaeribacter arboris TaxID=2072846 RepID=A0A2T2YHQ5_9BACT|nr:hypothetical protein [Adhaeribacter arboris]PSR55034.1 hypothetical protein AHMF7605_16750 [Adhaeribacter arboris]